MSSTRPLELPEVLSHVAKFIPLKHLPSNALVSRAWSDAFVPYIWRNIKFDEEHPHPPPSISSHSHLIKTLEITCTVTPEHAALRCPNLESLYLTGVRQNALTLQLIMEHPTLSRLRLDQLWSNYQTPFWEKLLGFQHLKDLTLSTVTFSEEDINKFWQLCTRLERLEFHALRTCNQGDLPSMEFPLIKEVKFGLGRQDEVPLSLDLVQRCPSLTSCNWKIGDRDADKQFVSGFVQLISEGTWKNLDRVDSESYFITNKDLSKIMEGMTQISVLNIGHTWDAFGLDSIDLLRPRFSSLKELSLGYCAKVTGLLAQEILSSCPMLEKLSVPQINAYEVVKGRPWVCLGLKKLSAKFCFPTATVSRFQPHVFDQLSKLLKLEELCIGGISDDSHIRRMRLQETFDLRLEHGLDKLSTLRSLSVISFLDTEQRMGDEEVDWILEHWTSMVNVNGALNTSKPRVDEALRGRLEAHGIHTRAPEKRNDRFGYDDDSELDSDCESI